MVQILSTDSGALIWIVVPCALVVVYMLTANQYALAAGIGLNVSNGLLPLLSAGAPMLLVGLLLPLYSRIRAERTGRNRELSNSALVALFLSTIPLGWVYLVAIGRHWLP
jgi:hypothetical protein